MSSRSAARGLVGAVSRWPATSSFARGYAAEAGGSKVVYPETKEEYLEAVKRAGSKTVSYFTAAWCGPCRAIAPLIDKMSLNYDQVAILKLDIDNESLQELAVQHDIASVPTFIFMKEQTVVDKCIGADPARVTAGIEKLM